MDSFYQGLDASFAEARRLIETGAEDRRSKAHCPSVATLDQQGNPSQRVMILRHTDWEARRLRFHTDARSTKIASIARNNSASILFYWPEDKIQLRLNGTLSISVAGDDVDQAWNSATLFARRAYMAVTAPGSVAEQPTSGLPEWIEGKQPTQEDITPARENFALLYFEFDKVEWLYLANSGHRRACWHWDAKAAKWEGSWLIP